MASLPILRYSLLILVLFSSILLPWLGLSGFLYIFFFFFSIPWHFFGMEAWPAPRGGQGTVIDCDMMRLMN